MRDTALRSLLAGSIDYAGLFPPAGLDMATPSASTPSTGRGPTPGRSAGSWCPWRRLARARGRGGRRGADRAGRAVARERARSAPSVARELDALGEFNCRHAADGAVALAADVVEARADSVEAVDRLLDAMPRWAQAYVEIPLDARPRAAGRRDRPSRRHGPRCAPAGSRRRRSPPRRRCSGSSARAPRRGVPFKATAGLHHPLRAEYRLTYAPDSPRGTMFGFLNVFLAARPAATRAVGHGRLALLQERSPRRSAFRPDAVEWQGHRVDRSTIEARGERGSSRSAPARSRSRWGKGAGSAR